MKDLAKSIEQNSNELQKAIKHKNFEQIDQKIYNIQNNFTS